MVPIGRHIIKYRPLVLTSGAIGIQAMPIRAPVTRMSWPSAPSIEEERRVQVLVRDNNVDQALKVLKKKMQREGVFREMKLRSHYEKAPRAPLASDLGTIVTGARQKAWPKNLFPTAPSA